MAEMSAPSLASPIRMAELPKWIPSERIMVFVAFGLALTSLLPYPGLAVGNNTGLEMYDALSLAVVPLVLIMGVPKRHLAAFMLFLVPAAISAVVAAGAGRIESVTTGAAVLVGLVLGFIPLICIGVFARKSYFTAILHGVCLATVIHTAAGAYQVYAFANGFFPFLGILRNPGYMPLDAVAENWTLYIRRPFGLFPEPSAMAASLVPWLIIMVGLLLYPDISPVVLGKGTRLWVLIAAAGGIWLVIWSRSGFVVPMILMLVALSIPRAVKAVSEVFVVRRMALVLVAIAAIWLMVIFAQNQFGNRLETSTAADPWADRRSSLEIGVRLPNNDLESLFLGVGPGQSTIILQDTKGLDTVWSVTIRNYADTGLFGLFCMLAIGGIVMFAILRSPVRYAGALAAVAWLFGITFVTSYGLNSIWFFLAFLLNWDHVFLRGPHPSFQPGFRLLPSPVEESFS